MEGDAGKATETHGVAEKVAEKLPVASESDIWMDDLAGFEIEEKMVEELMKLLEDEIEAPHSPTPALATINGGNEEKCGPTISESGSSVMENVDMGGVSISDLLGPTVFSDGTEGGDPAAGNGMLDLEMEDLLWELSDASGGANVAGNDDEWLEHVFGGPGFGFEPEKGFGF